ncbi:hypothetical protein C8T65DRAFT_200373 [Cerioporus squamosus]|nr:hypothetical protein C8T65DRAFT_200373 [Cerioporus squamosus]
MPLGLDTPQVSMSLWKSCKPKPTLDRRSSRRITYWRISRSKCQMIHSETPGSQNPWASRHRSAYPPSQIDIWIAPHSCVRVSCFLQVSSSCATDTPADYLSPRLYGTIVLTHRQLVLADGLVWTVVLCMLCSEMTTKSRSVVARFHHGATLGCTFHPNTSNMLIRPYGVSDFSSDKVLYAVRYNLETAEMTLRQIRDRYVAYAGHRFVAESTVPTML